MKRILINATQPDEVRVAITDYNLLVDLDIERPGYEQKIANIYKGRITSIEPSLAAVFVDYGSERHGFLPVKEISREYFLVAEDQELDTSDIRKILKIGQEIVVQVEKEERGTKGAALTTYISLAGSYLVLMPNNPKAGGISRRIEGEERDQIRDVINHLTIPEGMGIIIRTAGLGRTKEELEWDLNTLLKYWEAIKQAAVVKSAPYLIHQEGDVIIRAIRDYLRPDVSEIIIDEPQAFERSQNYIQLVKPDLISRLKLYTNHAPLLGRFQIEQQIEDAYQREVRLRSGGSIVIDHTEALVSIDINSASATKGTSIEETAYYTNLEAADEIARQLRIRDIGGLIVIDFIDMLSQRNQREVENRLRNALKLDRARIQIGRISRFGLMEMSRQHLRSPLTRASEITCPRCEGRGTIRGVESLVFSVIHLIQEQASKVSNTPVSLQVQLPVDIATYLLNEKRNILKEVEQHTGISVIVIPNIHFQSPQYHLKIVRKEQAKGSPSYKWVRMPKPDMPNKKTPTLPDSSQEPIVSQFLTSTLEPAPRKSSGQGLVKRLWTLIFGSDQEHLAHTSKQTREMEERPRERRTPSKYPPRKRNPNATRRNPHHQQNRDRTGDKGSYSQRASQNPTQQPRVNSHEETDNRNMSVKTNTENSEVLHTQTDELVSRNEKDSDS